MSACSWEVATAWSVVKQGIWTEMLVGKAAQRPPFLQGESGNVFAGMATHLHGIGVWSLERGKELHRQGRGHSHLRSQTLNSPALYRILHYCLGRMSISELILNRALVETWIDDAVFRMVALAKHHQPWLWGNWRGWAFRGGDWGLGTYTWRSLQWTNNHLGWGLDRTGVSGVGTGDWGLIHGDVVQWTNKQFKLGMGGNWGFRGRDWGLVHGHVLQSYSQLQNVTCVGCAHVGISWTWFGFPTWPTVVQSGTTKIIHADWLFCLGIPKQYRPCPC